jgi:hypothetical protein
MPRRLPGREDVEFGVAVEVDEARADHRIVGVVHSYALGLASHDIGDLGPAANDHISAARAVWCQHRAAQRNGLGRCGTNPSCDCTRSRSARKCLRIALDHRGVRGGKRILSTAGSGSAVAWCVGRTSRSLYARDQVSTTNLCQHAGKRARSAGPGAKQRTLRRLDSTADAR